jgi:hypothetical protein
MTLTEDQAEKVIRQICEGKEYWDSIQEYYEGEAHYYFYYRAEEKFYLRRMDVIVGSYSTVEEISREFLKDFLMTSHDSDFHAQGFRL